MNPLKAFFRRKPVLSSEAECEFIFVVLRVRHPCLFHHRGSEVNAPRSAFRTESSKTLRKGSLREIWTFPSTNNPSLFMVLTIAPPFPVPSSRLAGERPQFVAGKSAVNHMQVQFGPVLVGFIAR